jgi:hypothetical protein
VLCINYYILNVEVKMIWLLYRPARYWCRPLFHFCQSDLLKWINLLFTQQYFYIFKGSSYETPTMSNIADLTPDIQCSLPHLQVSFTPINISNFSFDLFFDTYWTIWKTIRHVYVCVFVAFHYFWTFLKKESGWILYKIDTEVLTMIKP